MSAWAIDSRVAELGDLTLFLSGLVSVPRISLIHQKSVCRKSRKSLADSVRSRGFTIRRSWESRSKYLNLSVY